MIKLPYGLADFYDLITQGYLYVDRTGYLRQLEEAGRVLLFIRPRRFGKSLWLQTLRCYYDFGLADQFDRLFGHLEIGRDPTPFRNQYFMLRWNFSEIAPSGGMEEIGAALRRHINVSIQALIGASPDYLDLALDLDQDPAIALHQLLIGVRKTPYKLYLLIDEYDNFINEVMVRDPAVYHRLVHTDGPFKQLFKSVKAATEGAGLERVFITGVTPIALNDLTSGFNIARDIYRLPRFNALCGFTESELRDVVARMVEEESLTPALAAEVPEVMRTWYNGYVFAERTAERVYNPTNCLYLLRHLQEEGTWPSKLYDTNLRMDDDKLTAVSRTAGAEMLAAIARDEGTIEVSNLEERFSLRELMTGISEDPRVVAAYLYYLGMLTQVGETPLGGVRLGIPNLVVKKLYLEQMLRLLLPESRDQQRADKIVNSFLIDGELSPLLGFVESKLLPAFSNRDQRWMKELTLKSIFLTLLFDDLNYAAFSELELAGGHPDLCLLRRPGTRRGELFDFLFEFKQVSLQTVAKTTDELRQLDDGALRALPEVAAALDAARHQIARYRRRFEERFGTPLRLRSYAVVGVGLARLVGEAVG